jgi:16S rRNA (guanine966-N2)-methyltransferase
MRVVSGEFRGRRLEAPKGARIRPTADRVREAIFSILGDVEGARVLDLFCGTGALGIEALSRGAARATFVDTRTTVVRRNVGALDLEDRCRIVRGDAIRHLRRDRARFDLVFCDPPYKLADRVGAQLDQLVPDRLREGGRLIVETAARHPFELSLPLLTERRYGDTLVRVHAREAR